MHDEIMAAIRARADSGATLEQIISMLTVTMDVEVVCDYVKKLTESGAILRIQGVNEVRYFPMPEALTKFVTERKQRETRVVVENKTTTKPEAVNHPAHYNTGKIEVIDFIEDQQLGFHEGNVVKYICRARHKGSELEDLKKGLWYLQRAIQKLEEE